MYKRLYIIGAGGHGKVIADLASKCGYTEIAFLDDHAEGTCMGFPILGKCADMDALSGPETAFVLAIGSNETRKRISQEHHVTWATLIHPTAQIGLNVTIGEGTVVMAGAVINPCTTIGRHCIINTCAVVEHDNVLADFVHISPNAALGGTVVVGAGTHVGIGATVKNSTKIYGNCVIGAGAAIVRDINEVGVYVGTPGKKIR